MKYAIFTIAIKNSVNRKMYECTLNTVRHYAKKIGADLIVQTKKKIHHPHYVPHMEKFNLSKLLEKYDRVLYVDSDILITKNAPNIFDKYPDTNAVYMFNQAQIKSYNKPLSRIKDITGKKMDFWYKKNNRLAYFNTGVILASRPHRKYFTLGKDYFDYIFEQGYINYKLMKHHVPIKELDTKFNRLVRMYKEKKGYFLHYITGIKNREKVVVNEYKRLFKQK